MAYVQNNFEGGLSMKIALPVENKSADSAICPSFGRTPFFLIYDSETKDRLFVDNGAVASQGGAGIKAAQAIVDQGARVLITPRCGENAANVIKRAGIAMYKSQGTSITENIEAFLMGTLPLLDQIHPGFHNHGSN